MKSPFSHRTVVRQILFAECLHCGTSVVRRRSGRWVHAATSKIRSDEPTQHEAMPRPTSIRSDEAGTNPA